MYDCPECGKPHKNAEALRGHVRRKSVKCQTLAGQRVAEQLAAKAELMGLMATTQRAIQACALPEIIISRETFAECQDPRVVNPTTGTIYCNVSQGTVHQYLPCLLPDGSVGPSRWILQARLSPVGSMH